MFAGWEWPESEARTASGGFLFGRASDASGYIEGIHDQYASPAGLLIDEAKSIRDEVLDTLSRCHVTFRLFASSTSPASGGFYRICTAFVAAGGSPWAAEPSPADLFATQPMNI
jgi:hypothetical protein